MKARLLPRVPTRHPPCESSLSHHSENFMMAAEKSGLIEVGDQLVAVGNKRLNSDISSNVAGE